MPRRHCHGRVQCVFGHFCDISFRIASMSRSELPAHSDHLNAPIPFLERVWSILEDNSSLTPAAAALCLHHAAKIRSMPLLTTTGEHARILKYSQERKLVTVFQPKRVYGTTIIAHIYPCIYTCANCCTQMSKRPSLQGRAVTLTARKRFSVVSFFLIQIQGTENQSFAKRKRQMSVSLFVSG